jgi:DNA-binding MarR family transcriptional regulator
MSHAPDLPAGAVPPRTDWPELPGHTPAGALLTELVIATFRLNARLQEIAQRLAAHGGLTAAWWQVLGGVLDQPRTVADVARAMGMSRQGVQRVADLLVDHELAEYRPNPAHRRAKLLSCTDAGLEAIRQIAVSQRPWADRTGATIGAEGLGIALTTMHRLIAVLEGQLERDDALEAEPIRPAGSPARAAASRRRAPERR